MNGFIAKGFGALAIGMMFLLGCGDSSNDSEDPASTVTEVSPGNLVIYSGRSEKLVGPIVNQFQEATGINVSVKYGKTGAIAATLLEEGTSSPADVFFAQDPGGLGAVANNGQLSPLSSTILDLSLIHI